MLDFEIEVHAEDLNAFRS